MSNTSRGVMKIPTDGFATATPITAPVETETGGVAYETIAAMKGIEQLDLLDAAERDRTARSEGGALNLIPLLCRGPRSHDVTKPRRTRINFLGFAIVSRSRACRPSVAASASLLRGRLGRFQQPAERHPLVESGGKARGLAVEVRRTPR